jgi:hypothetical protein
VRSEQESSVINRVLKARGMPTLDRPGVVAALACQVQDHAHFMELLRACEPMLRREMYEAMRPHLRFPALPLEDYILGAKAHAEAAELPVMDEEGFLHPYSPGVVETEKVPPVALWAKCFKCAKESIFLGVHEGDAIHTMRNAGWAYDESAQQAHLCPECLDAVD